MLLIEQMDDFSVLVKIFSNTGFGALNNNFEYVDNIDSVIFSPLLASLYRFKDGDDIIIRPIRIDHVELISMVLMPLISSFDIMKYNSDYCFFVIPGEKVLK